MLLNLRLCRPFGDVPAGGAAIHRRGFAELFLEGARERRLRVEVVLQGDIQDRAWGGAQRLRRLRQAPLADIAAERVAGGAAEHALQVPFGVA